MKLTADQKRWRHRKVKRRMRKAKPELYKAIEKKYKGSARGKFIRNLRHQHSVLIKRDKFFGEWIVRELDRICEIWKVKMINNMIRKTNDTEAYKPFTPPRQKKDPVKTHQCSRCNKHYPRNEEGATNYHCANCENLYAENTTANRDRNDEKNLSLQAKRREKQLKKETGSDIPYYDIE